MAESAKYQLGKKINILQPRAAIILTILYKFENDFNEKMDTYLSKVFNLSTV